MKTNMAINVLEAYRVNHLGLNQSKIVAKLVTQDMRNNFCLTTKSKHFTQF